MAGECSFGENITDTKHINTDAYILIQLSIQMLLIAFILSRHQCVRNVDTRRHQYVKSYTIHESMYHMVHFNLLSCSNTQMFDAKTHAG